MPYHRYDGATETNEVSMPKDELDARASSMCIGEVVGRFERFCNDPSEKELYPWAERFVMGFPLPSWQRPPVWTDEQKIRFIESIWQGVDIGSYMTNHDYKFVKGKNGKEVMLENSEILLDGQQRLSAIEEYITGKFPVADVNGDKRYWGELSKFERRRFCNYQFAHAYIKSFDEALLRKAYDLRAFGGTPHTPDQRASDVISDAPAWRDILEPKSHIGHIEIATKMSAQLGYQYLAWNDTIYRVEDENNCVETEFIVSKGHIIKRPEPARKPPRP